MCAVVNVCCEVRRDVRCDVCSDVCCNVCYDVHICVCARVCEKCAAIGPNITPCTFRLSVALCILVCPCEKIAFLSQGEVWKPVFLCDGGKDPLGIVVNAQSLDLCFFDNQNPFVWFLIWVSSLGVVCVYVSKGWAVWEFVLFPFFAW